MENLSGGNYTRTGFLLKKLLQEDIDVTPAWNRGTNDWIVFRYAEILLNYAEAIIESGYTQNNAQVRAEQAP